MARPDREPDAVALSFVDRIGEAWRVADDDLRRRLLAEWLAELRLFPDGAVEVVPRALGFSPYGRRRKHPRGPRVVPPNFTPTTAAGDA